MPRGDPAGEPIRAALADVIQSTGLTQAVLAERSGVGQSTLSAILTGARADQRAATVARLARAASLSPTTLGKLLYSALEAAENNSEKYP